MGPVFLGCFVLVRLEVGDFPITRMAGETYEEMRARLTDANEGYLALWTNDLILEKKMGKKKAHEHAERLRFFGNDYLLNYESEDLVEGVSSFSSFVGDWFIRKCMWSDVRAVKVNVESFRLWLRFLVESEKISQEDLIDLYKRLERDLDTWCLRARCYNDPEWEPEDLFDEYGMWDDEALKKRSGGVIVPKLILGTGRLHLNLLLSAKVSKFVGIQPPELVKLAQWGDWESPEHRWFSNWRCEECFGMKGSKDKVVMVTNQVTRYSVLIRIPGKDPKRFLTEVHTAIMRAFDQNEVARPGKIELAVKTLSGAARSLASFQNQQMHAIDHIVERPEVKYLEDAEKPLNDVPTNYSDAFFPDQLFAEMCREEPPFQEMNGPDNVVPFLN